MRLFRTAVEKELDAVLLKVDNNMSNNYKDAAQENYREFLKRFEEAVAGGELPEKKVQYYKTVIEDYAARLSKFTHKDQPTKWGAWEKR